MADIITQDVCITVENNLFENKIISPHRFIALTSGLELSGSSCDSVAALELAVSWMVGDAGEMTDQVLQSVFDMQYGNRSSEKLRSFQC